MQIKNHKWQWSFFRVKKEKAHISDQEKRSVTKIINMSDINLTQAQIKLLSKGLKFTPTPNANLPDLEHDMKGFCRRLRLKENFFDNNKSDEEDTEGDPLVRNKSNWNPKPKRNLLLDSCIDTLTKSSKDLGSFSIKSNRDNLSKTERRALLQLQKNKDIIIKEADKGGAICIMNKTFYASKLTKMLQDPKTYKQIDNDPGKKILSKIKNLVHEHKHCLKEEEIDFILNFECKGSNFYGLPKVHKSREVKSAVENLQSEYVKIPPPDDLKFRPIVAGPACHTSRLSQLIDTIIKGLPQYTKSYVRDDIDFLSKLNRTLPLHQKHLLVTFDVESLYSNIDKDLGMEAIRYWVKKLKHKVNGRFTEDFICDALKIILENNTFHFNDQYYLQVLGVAMGTRMAPSYANLALAYLEEKLYTIVKEKYGSEFGTYVEQSFLRYLDDCFIIWPHSKWDVDLLATELNNLHPSLKFTQECSPSEIPFLDILVYLKNNAVYTDLYYKPTDTHQYLHFNSCHPRHTKHNIPYSQARRLCTIIDDTEIRDKRLADMANFFIERGYPTKLVELGINKAKAIPQSTLRQVKPKDNIDTLPFVFTHNPSNPNMVPLVKSTLNILNTDSRMKKVLDSTKFIASRRQPNNLGRMLTKACFTMSTRENVGQSSKCNDPRCGTCNHLHECNVIDITSTKRKFYIKSQMNCKTKNVLYIMTCQGCNEQYVGMTNDALNARVRVHKQQINNPCYRKLGVSKHIDECSDKDIKFLITPFFKLTDSKSYGLIKEEMFIQQFKPSLNGLTL